VSKHDVNWISEIESLISDNVKEDALEVVQAAKNYWDGVPHQDEQLWEYITTSAKIMSVVD
jgi:uncharacterized NAD(P)/FAD-binding protein YdhS